MKEVNSEQTDTPLCYWQEEGKKGMTEEEEGGK